MRTDANVAYNGTAADLLNGGGDAMLFETLENIDWDSELDRSCESLPMENFYDTAAVVNNGTVSPQDIFKQALSSVPASTTVTNLTTPGSTFLDTPDESFQNTPYLPDNMNFGNMGSGYEIGQSFFPDLSATNSNDISAIEAPAMSRTISSNSDNQILVHPGGESRKRSSNASPMIAGSRPSTSAGISKREKALPPIIADRDDPAALKRARNTAAARKSRDKKVKERETFESRIQELEAEVAFWKAKALASDAAQGF